MAAYSRIEGVRSLQADSCSDVKDSYGRTPLSLGAENEHEAIVKLLLEKGADPDTKEYDGHKSVTGGKE